MNTNINSWHAQPRSEREPLSAINSKRNSTIDDDYIKNRSSSITISNTKVNRQSIKKPFLKKGSRQFLAPSNVEANKNKTYQIDTKSARPRKEQPDIPKQSLPQNLKKSITIPTKSISTNCQSVCIPPQLLISRISGKIIDSIQSGDTIRKVFDDGRISIQMKQQQIVQQYLGDIIFTQFPNKDYKLQWNCQIIYWIQLCKCYQINDQFFFQ